MQVWDGGEDGMVNVLGKDICQVGELGRIRGEITEVGLRIPQSSVRKQVIKMFKKPQVMRWYLFRSPPPLSAWW